MVNGVARLIPHQREWHKEPQRGERTGEQSVKHDRSAADDHVLMLYVEDLAAIRADLVERGYLDPAAEADEVSFYLADFDGHEVQVIDRGALTLDFRDD